MMSFLLILVPVAIILIISSGLVKLFDYKIEHANFITVCSISLLLIIFGLIGLLNVGLYLIFACALASLIYLGIKKFNFLQIFTPSIVFYVLAIMIFSFLIRGISLFTHDEVAHWALATKTMYYGGEFYKGLQGMFTATFNYFITKTTYYAESQLYTGAWILIWSAFLLPMGEVKWGNWKKASAYIFACYCLTGYLMKDVTFHTDEFMAFMTGAVIVYWSMLRTKSIKSYVLASVGILAVAQIKESFGPLCAIFISVFIIANELIINNKNEKKKALKLLSLIAAAGAGFFLSVQSISKPAGYLTTGAAFKLPVLDLLIKSKSFLLLCAASAVLFVLFFVFFNSSRAITLKNRSFRFKTVTGVLLCLSVMLVIYKFTMLFLLSLSFEAMNEYVYAWRNFFYTTQGGIINIYSLAGIFLFVSFAGILALKKDEFKITFSRGLIICLNILFMGALVLIAYSTGFDETGMYTSSMSWDRYTSVPFIIAYTYIAGYYILSTATYISRERRIAAAFIILIFIARYLPFPTTIIFAKYSDERIVFKGIQNAIKEDSDIITEYLDKDDTVFVASYYYEKNANEWGEGRVKWLKYEITPIESSWNYNEDFDEVTGSTGSVETHAANIGKYDYLYIQSAGPEYYKKFGVLFPGGNYYYSNALYKVDYSNGVLSLSPVFLDETRLLP